MLLSDFVIEKTTPRAEFVFGKKRGPNKKTRSDKGRKRFMKGLKNAAGSGAKEGFKKGAMVGGLPGYIAGTATGMTTNALVHGAHEATKIAKSITAGGLNAVKSIYNQGVNTKKLAKAGAIALGVPTGAIGAGVGAVGGATKYGLSSLKKSLRKKKR
jgi:hypothetical protein